MPALEAYWAAFTAWLLDRTDRASCRHREVVARIRELAVVIGEDLVALRHSRCVPVAMHLDQLAWQLRLSAQRAALGADVQARCGQAVEAARGLLASSVVELRP